MYTDAMRILCLFHQTKYPNTDGYLIGKQLMNTLHYHGHQVFVLSNFQFKSPDIIQDQITYQPKTLLQKNNEDAFIAKGLFHPSTFTLDVQQIQSIIHKYQIETIIEYQRPAGLVAAKQTNTKIISIVDSPLYHPTPHSLKSIAQINHCLQNTDQPQVISLAELYSRATLRIGFGPIITNPFPYQQMVKRIGSFQYQNIEPKTTNQIMIYFTPNSKNRYFSKIIDEAFHHSNYQVFIHLNSHFQKEKDNLHYISQIELPMIYNSIMVIHDGNPYLANLCHTFGIPQLLLSNQQYPTTYMANSIQRNHLGVVIHQYDLSVASLYEAFRKIVIDDQYDICSKQLINQTKEFGDLHQLITLL